MDCHTSTEIVVKDFHILSYDEYMEKLNTEFPELWKSINKNVAEEGQFFSLLEFIDPKFKEFLADFYSSCRDFVVNSMDGHNSFYDYSSFDLYRTCIYEFLKNNKDKHEDWINIVKFKIL